MARRTGKSLIGRSWQRTFNALTRATFGAGTRAVVKATRRAVSVAQVKTPRQRMPATQGGRWTTGVALGPAGARRYRVFKPGGAVRSAPRPLLVMLHGCNQDAAGFARSTRLQSLAAREGFILLFPEQERLANPQGCWNWFETRSGRAFNEATSILAAVDQACLLHGADPSRVAVAGFSAGAGMAALLALRHPERFAAAVMHSGIAPGVAHSTATAIGAMQGHRRAEAQVSMVPLPPLLVIQGSADHVVAASNGRGAAASWASAAGAQPRPPRSVQRGARYPMTLTDFKHRGATLATLCEVSGLGHAWSGGATGQPYSDPKGPDAGRMVWAFAARCFKPVTPRKVSAVGAAMAG